MLLGTAPVRFAAPLGSEYMPDCTGPRGLMRSAAIALMLCCVCPAQPAAKIDFQREIRPILSNACFHCHGPDKDSRMAGLRLDTRQGAFEQRKNGTPVKPGDPASSLIYARITNPDKARRMPPEYSHRTLTAEQIEKIRAWIEQGADWKEQWSFSAPVRPQLPKVARGDWGSNPIDSFILADLEKNGLEPAPQADRRTLIRRVSLDLTGLPPEPEAVDEFVRDPRPDAYERLVDRLLASPRWGEHRGRYWLDAARYADTHGIHIDNYREMWPYRDWVIRAINANMPFDQFTIEQIAGDLLPNPTLDQLIATGFHRCNVTTNEGGSIPEEVAAMYAKDRADTTGAVFLGLTVGCATCHDHKFDPISQRDFYSLTAFFRNTVQDPLDGNIPDTPPSIVVPRAEDMPRWKQLRDQESSLKRRMAGARKDSETEFNAWLDGESRPKIATPLEPADELFAMTVADRPAFEIRNKGYRLPATQKPIVAAGKDGRKAVTFRGKSAIELPGLEYFEADRAFSVAAWVFVPEKKGNYTVVSQMDPASRRRGWALSVNNGLPVLALNLAPGRGASIRAANDERLKPGTWNHIATTYDGSRDPSGLALYVNGHTVMFESRADRKPFPGNFRNYAPMRMGGDEKAGNFDGGAISELRIYTRAISEEEARLVSIWPIVAAARRTPAAQLNGEQKDALRLYFLNRQYSDYVDLAQQFQAVRDEKKVIARRGAVTLIQQERPGPAFAYVLYRGMYDQPREKVEPAVPTALPPMPASFPKNRLGLAEWLVSADNPLVARVTVNRFWQEVFGTGIVKTPEDFGSQGQPPSNQPLLDWLAVEFRESGWDVKNLFRLLVTSSTYRQAAVTTPLKLAKDPDNRMLSRGPRFRMDAEMIRDSALAAAGLLSSKIGGPSLKPYQPERIWETVAMDESNTRFYQQDYGDALYRRSLYTFWKRSAPPPSMDIMNAPTRETCTVRRERTDTPLQALVTLNDVQFVEAARNLAAHAMRSAGKDEVARLDYMSRRVLSRVLDEQERAVLLNSEHGFLQYYGAHPEDAARLVRTGETPVEQSGSRAELAALTMVANQILNLDEALNK